MQNYVRIPPTWHSEKPYLLLVDEDEDGRFDARLEDLDEQLAFAVFVRHLDDLLRSLSRFAHRSDVNDGRTTKVRSGVGK